MAEQTVPAWQPPPRRPGWFKRHPVISWTVGAIVALWLLLGILMAPKVNEDTAKFYVFGYGAGEKAIQTYGTGDDSRCTVLADFFENQGTSMGSFRDDFVMGCQDAYAGRVNKYPDTPFPFPTNSGG